MKKWTKIFLAAALIACMVIQAAAVASPAPLESTPVATETAPMETEPETTASETTEPTEPETTEPEVTEPETTEPEAPELETTEPEVTEPETDPLEGYTFPDNWAGEPLRFAVRYGILMGRENRELDPTGKTSRVEMAAMLVRLLGATETGDLSRYTDLNPKGWYLKELGTAVHMGIFMGITDTKMAPNRAITRQEAFTVLARAFGLHAEDPEAYRVFKDCGKVQPYARDAISALYELGCVNGYETGYLKPGNTIARQEVASLFYELLDDICVKPEKLPESGFVLYRGSAPLTDCTLDGTLILAAGLPEETTISGLSVTDRVILRCATGTKLNLADLDTPRLSVVSPMTVSVTGQEVPLLTVYGEGSVLDIPAQRAEVFAGCTLNADCGDAVIEKSADGKTVSVNGNVSTVAVYGDEITVTGSGYAETVTVYGRNCDIRLNCGSMEEKIDWGLAGVKVTMSGTEQVSANSPEATVKATFTGFTAGYGCENGGRVCRVQWYLDGKLVSTQGDFFLKEGAVATYTHTFDKIPGESPVFTAVLTCGEESVRGTWTVKVDSYQWDYDHALEIVETVNIPGETRCKTKLYSDSARSSVLKTVPAGVTVTHLYYSGDGAAPGKVRLSDGTVGWMDWEDYLVSRKDFTQYTDYSVGAKEGFVNKKGYSSSTGYLIWTSLKTQKVNVFKGSKGNWKLIKTFSCATGKNTTPTVSGVYSIIYKTERWRFDEWVDGKYVEDHNRVYNVTGFWGGQAFHSRLYLSSDGSLYDGTMGAPVSHGCVRMMDDGCAYIYDLPYGTTVVNY